MQDKAAIRTKDGVKIKLRTTCGGVQLSITPTEQGSKNTKAVIQRLEALPKVGSFIVQISAFLNLFREFHLPDEDL